MAQWISGTELHVWKKVGLISFSTFYLPYPMQIGNYIFTNTWRALSITNLLFTFCSSSISPFDVSNKIEYDFGNIGWWLQLKQQKLKKIEKN